MHSQVICRCALFYVQVRVLLKELFMERRRDCRTVLIIYPSPKSRKERLKEKKIGYQILKKTL